MSLEEIGHALDNGGSDLGDALSRLQQQVRAEIEDLERIQSALEQLIELENHAGRVTPDDVRALMEATKMINAYYTDEQLEKLDERYQQLSSEDLTRVQREWQEVFAALRHAMDDGCAPDHPRVARAARTANRLIEEFTGGDEGIRSSLESMYEGEGHQAVLDHRGYDVDEGLSGFLRRALDALPDE
jgi:regulator of replication initiation timing